MTSFHVEKCCHLKSEHEASAARLCSSVRQFPIYSTFVFVVKLWDYIFICIYIIWVFIT